MRFSKTIKIRQPIRSHSKLSQKKQTIYNRKMSTGALNTNLLLCLNPGTGKFFRRPDAESLPPGLRDGNCHAFCFLPKTTFGISQKDTAAFAYPSGTSPLPFNSSAVFIGLRKKYPDP
jgi:hypothetical protein